MPANRRRSLLVTFFVLAMTVPGLADESLPDVEFLEYLGSWAEDDEEWLIIAEESEADRESDAVDVEARENDGAKNETDN